MDNMNEYCRYCIWADKCDADEKEKASANGCEYCDVYDDEDITWAEGRPAFNAEWDQYVAGHVQ